MYSGTNNKDQLQVKKKTLKHGINNEIIEYKSNTKDESPQNANNNRKSKYQSNSSNFYLAHLTSSVHCK